MNFYSQKLTSPHSRFNGWSCESADANQLYQKCYSVSLYLAYSDVNPVYIALNCIINIFQKFKKNVCVWQKINQSEFFVQELQNQLILQSLLGLNGSLVLQPSMDQQTVQQTVQTIQQQSVQTIQQQTVQSQTIQTVQQQTVQPQVQHTIQSLQPQIQQQTVQQTIQHQTVNALQQPMQIVQPQPIHSLHSQVST